MIGGYEHARASVSLVPYISATVFCFAKHSHPCEEDATQGGLDCREAAAYEYWPGESQPNRNLTIAATRRQGYVTKDAAAGG